MTPEEMKAWIRTLAERQQEALEKIARLECAIRDLACNVSPEAFQQVQTNLKGDDDE